MAFIILMGMTFGASATSAEGSRRSNGPDDGEPTTDDRPGKPVAEWLHAALHVCRSGYPRPRLASDSTAT